MSPEFLLLGVLWAAVALYAVFGGADFGAGVWEFSTAMRGSRAERRLVLEAIGPVWEANHVWLIFVLVLLWTAFPAAFEAVVRAAWLPLSLALVGIVFRGVGFAYRTYASDLVRQERAWGAVFSLASTAAPLCLGAAAGAVASGELDVAPDGAFHGDPLTDWLRPISIFTALLAVGACAYLAAVFLTREAHAQGEAALVETWRRRALGTGAWMGVLAAAGLAVVATDAPRLWDGFGRGGWPFVALSAAGGLGSLAGLHASRFTLAAAGAAVAVASMVAGWGAAQYPYLVPPTVTVASAAAPPAVMRAAVVVAAAGAAVLVPSLWLLFRIFKRSRASPER